MIAARLTKRQFHEAIMDSRHKTLAMYPTAPYRHQAARIGRNDRCPCGSGMKFKVCHLVIQQGFTRAAG